VPLHATLAFAAHHALDCRDRLLALLPVAQKNRAQIEAAYDLQRRQLSGIRRLASASLPEGPNLVIEVHLCVLCACRRVGSGAPWGTDCGLRAWPAQEKRFFYNGL
jgi:hypothetical protein